MRTVILYQRVLFSISLLHILLLTGCDKQPPEDMQIHVVFRLDDYSSRTSTDMELDIIDAFRKNEASITLGVIPFVCAGDWRNPSPQDIVPLASTKGDILKTGVQDGILDIALHGYSHQTIDAVEIAEFSGLGYDDQVERLAKGKRFLEGIIDAPVTTFVPPWNQYDLNTLQALEELGFSTLSAGRKGKAAKGSKLRFLPQTCDLPQLRDAVAAARTCSYNQLIIVVVFHLYEFREIDEKRGIITYREFSDLLNWLKSQEDVRLLSISQATEVIRDLSAERLLLAIRHCSLNRLLPSSLRKEGVICLYQESPALPRMLLKVCGFYLSIVGLGAFFSFVAGMLLFPRSTFIMNTCTFASMLLSAIIIVYAFHDLQIYPKGMMAIAVVVGSSIGLCICSLYLRKRKGLD